MTNKHNKTIISEVRNQAAVKSLITSQDYIVRGCFTNDTR